MAVFFPPDPDHKLNKFISKSSTLAGCSGGNVSLSPKFISELIGVLTDFFEKLDHEIQTFMQLPDK